MTETILDPERVRRARAKAKLHVQAAMRLQNESKREHEKAKSIARTWGFTLRELKEDDA